MNHDYIFRFPAGAPDLDFTSLSAWLGLRHTRQAGTTVTVTYLAASADEAGEIWGARFEIMLYRTVIAWVYADRVYFPGPDDPHHATTAWISKIVRDNAIGGGVFRIRRHKTDGPGPRTPRGRAGLLVIGGNRDKPVPGRAYPVGDIESRRARERQWREQWAAAGAEIAERARFNWTRWELDRRRAAAQGDAQAAADLHELGMLPLTASQAQALYEAHARGARFEVPDTSGRIRELEQMLMVQEPAGENTGAP